MTYEDDLKVKDVYVTFTVKFKAKVALFGEDYNQSDGTDADAFCQAFSGNGLPDWNEMELSDVLFIREIE